MTKLQELKDFSFSSFVFPFFGCKIFTGGIRSIIRTTKYVMDARTKYRSPRVLSSSVHSDSCDVIEWVKDCRFDHLCRTKGVTVEKKY